MNRTIIRKKRLPAGLIFAVIVLLVATSLVMGAKSAAAQGDARFFPETGYAVHGRFLEYWNANGGLAQQGLPISDEIQEKSDTDGKTYTVQYFERAVFELHPENKPPNDVLLSLLGYFFYKQRYPESGGAPYQNTNVPAGAKVFPETGKWLAGGFLDYWNAHGGLAQQGYPISNEFVEVSPTDGKRYTVQYFQRAVFEYHPEFKGTPNEILLSLLGAFGYKGKYPYGPTAQQQTAATPAPAPAGACNDVPAPKNASITPACGPEGTVFYVSVYGFQANEPLSVYFTDPGGKKIDTGDPITDHPGRLEGMAVQTDEDFGPGIWSMTFHGTVTKEDAVVWFKITR